MSYKLLLVKEDEDFIIVTEKSCLECASKKGDFTILKSVSYSESEVLRAVKTKVGQWRPKIYNVKCICDKS